MRGRNPSADTEVISGRGRYAPLPFPLDAQETILII